MEKIIRFDGEQFLCKHFYDIDGEYESVEVYLLESNRYIGEIYNIGIPDEKDLDKVAKFEETVSEWLLNKDVNYTHGN